VPFDRQKFRTLIIPISTYRSVKHTAAEIDRTMNELLAAAWANYFENNIQEILITMQEREKRVTALIAKSSSHHSFD
jgi:hypothetical protein